MQLNDAERKRGLQPVDWYKLGHTTPDAVEELYETGPDFARMGLQADHVVNLLSPAELELMCFKKDRTTSAILDEASQRCGVPPETFPPELVEAWHMRTLYHAKKGRRQEYRRVVRKAAKAAKQSLKRQVNAQDTQIFIIFIKLHAARYM